MKKINRIISVIVFGSIVSCSSSNKHEKYLKNVISDFPNDSNKYCVYVIIPSISCVTCNNYAIKKCQDFIKKEYPVKIIFECVPENYKAFCFKLEGAENKSNVIIDTLLRYSLPDTVALANLPIIIYLDGNKIENIKIHNSKNIKSFENLEEKLLKISLR